MKLKRMSINFLGDSITFGVGTSSEDKRYFELIKEKHKLSKATG